MVSLAPSHQSDQRRNRRLLLVSSCMEQYAVLQGASLPNVSVAVVNWPVRSSSSRARFFPVCQYLLERVCEKRALNGGW